MTSALLVALLALSSGAKSKQPAARLEQATKDFNKGDFPTALKALESLAGETSDRQLLTKVYLLRGQIYGAQQDFGKAEDAFGDALETDAEASLDPAKVDPALVKLLDGLRARMKGELRIATDTPGAMVVVDGKALGATPQSPSVSIGRHTVEVTSVSGRFTVKQEVLVQAGRSTDVRFAFTEREAEAGTPGGAPAPSAFRPFGDLRAQLDPFDLFNSFSFLIGGGVEWSYYRLGVNAQLVPVFGLVPRGALVVPIIEHLDANISVHLPVYFENPLSVGLGGLGGIEYRPSKWMGVFFEAGAEHFFVTGRRADNRVLVDFGVRLRLP